MILIVLVVSVVVAALQVAILWRLPVSIVPKKRPSVEAAVRDAYVECGLPEALYADDFDLSRTGKLHAVQHYAAQRLGIAPPQTVGDLIAWLGE